MEVIYVLILFFAFIAGESKNLKTSSVFLIPQGLLISISLFMLGYFHEVSSLYIIGILDLIVRAAVLPFILIQVFKNIEEEKKPSIVLPLSIPISIVLLALGYHFALELKNIIFHQFLSCFPAGLTLFVFGLFLIVSKADILKIIISFFIIENGIHLMIIGLVPYTPKTFEIALTFNFILAMTLFIYIGLRWKILIMQEKRYGIKTSDDLRG